MDDIEENPNQTTALVLGICDPEHGLKRYNPRDLGSGDKDGVVDAVRARGLKIPFIARVVIVWLRFRGGGGGGGDGVGEGDCGGAEGGVRAVAEGGVRRLGSGEG
ncbi:hypothetical protein Droror1_Dr00019532 [Drosera rotundifolia]